MSEDNSNIIININGTGQQSYSQPVAYSQPPIVDQPVQYQPQMPMAAVAVSAHSGRSDSFYYGLAAMFLGVSWFLGQMPTPTESQSFRQNSSMEESDFPALELPRSETLSPEVPTRVAPPPVVRPVPPSQPKAQPRRVEPPNAPLNVAPVSSGVDQKWKQKKSAAFINKTVTIAKDLQVNPNYLFAIMDFESAGINHRKVNPKSGATGLIQFMPKTAQSLGTSTQALRNMSEIDQLGYVHKYFRPYKGRIKDLPDIYCAVLWPKCVGKPPDYVLFRRGQITYSQNNGFDKNGDGVITKAETTTLVKGRR